MCHQKITTDAAETKYFEPDKSGIIREKKLYLDLFLDMYNSEIISYRTSEKQNALAITEVLEKAILVINDFLYCRTFHFDQGWDYQMRAYNYQLKEHKIFQSMSHKGTCLDNSIMENFFSLLKHEVYHSFEELKQTIDDYIYYYNHERMKKKI